MDPLTLLTLLIIGLFAGIASGFVGVGGGLILVPAMVAFTGLGQHAAQGTSLAMMLPPVGILAVMQYHRAGEVHWAYALVLCVTFVAGAWGGSKMSLKGQFRVGVQMAPNAHPFRVVLCRQGLDACKKAHGKRVGLSWVHA